MAVLREAPASHTTIVVISLTKFMGSSIAVHKGPSMEIRLRDSYHIRGWGWTA